MKLHQDLFTPFVECCLAMKLDPCICFVMEADGAHNVADSSAYCCTPARIALVVGHFSCKVVPWPASGERNNAVSVSVSRVYSSPSLTWTALVQKMMFGYPSRSSG